MMVMIMALRPSTHAHLVSDRRMLQAIVAVGRRRTPVILVTEHGGIVPNGRLHLV
jgi:hypothetical protein